MAQKGPNPTGHSSLGRVTCPISALSPRHLSHDQNFPPSSRVSLRKSNTQVSLSPRTPLPLLLLSLPETPQLTELEKGGKTPIFDVFWPFLQGQSWKGSSQETTEPSAEKKADGQRLCQTNSCCCSYWMYLPNKSWGIRESHLQRFSGIYVPGRSSGQGVEP